MLVQISAASLVTLANTGGIPTASKTGYDASDAIEATDDNKPPATPPNNKKITVQIVIFNSFPKIV